MNGLYAALWMECLKVRRSKMLIVTILAFAFIGMMMALLAYAAQHPEIAGRSAAMSAKASIMGKGDWLSFLGLLIQSILTVGTLGIGVVTSWVFGREYSDRVIKALLALPVSRVTIVIAKFIVIAIWSMLLASTLLVVGFLMGLVVHIPGWSTGEVFHMIIIFTGSSVLTMLLCTPVAFIACVGRGYLLPIGFTIFTLVLTQLLFVGVPNVTPFIPWAIPALYSGVAAQAAPQISIASFVVLGITCAAGFLGAIGWWQFADQT